MQWQFVKALNSLSLRIFYQQIFDKFNSKCVAHYQQNMQPWLSFFPDTSHKHPIHTKMVVEIPSSGSANEKEDKSAIVEIAAANKYGMIFFISGRFMNSAFQKSNQNTVVFN